MLYYGIKVQNNYLPCNFFEKGAYVRLLSFPFHVVPPTFLSSTLYSLIAADATAVATVPF